MGKRAWRRNEATITTSSLIEALPDRRELYNDLISDLEKLPIDKQRSRLRTWYRNDLYFLIRYGLHRHDFEHDWLLARCREVQLEPNDVLNLWARDHRKTTIITLGLSTQDILNNPEVTICILSYTRPIAKGFLRMLKREYEDNTHLKSLFPDIFFDNPKKDSPKWSEDDGLIVKRITNPPESTIEAWGMVDAQPTSKHFMVLDYDDIVVESSIGSPEMIAKTTKGYELSRNLERSTIEGSGITGCVSRYAGTRYHFNDSYSELMRRGIVKTRIHKATEDGSADGVPVLLTREQLDKKRREMGPYVFSCQMLMDPVEDEAQGFKYEWVRFYEREQRNYGGMNKYLLVDPASGKRPTNDYTAMGVIGLGPDGNYYLLDGVRDRLNLTQRAKWLFDMHRKWGPMKVGYEKYGMQADIEHLKREMQLQSYHFDIIELSGPQNKNDRIRRLIPIFEQNKFYLPDTLWYTDYQGQTIDLVTVFINEEYKAFPVPVHDDFFDMMARITDGDLGAIFPKAVLDKERREERYSMKRQRKGGSSWMGR